MQILSNGARQCGLYGAHRSVSQSDEYGLNQNYGAQQRARRDAAKSRNSTSK